MNIGIAEQDARERAYALWQARGCPEGNPDEDWFAAEAQLKAELDAATTLEPLAQKDAEALEQETEASASTEAPVRVHYPSLTAAKDL